MLPSSTDHFRNRSQVSMDACGQRCGDGGIIVWLTGLSGAGKSTIAHELAHALRRQDRPVYLLDGDDLRRGLCSDLGFSAADRTENVRRAAEVATLFAHAGWICIAAFISPLRADRARARALLPTGRFIEAHVAAPVEICRQRDPKGLYARADRGEITNFTGVSAPYEAPTAPEIVLRSERDSIADCVAQILRHLGHETAVNPPVADAVTVT